MNTKMLVLVGGAGFAFYLYRLGDYNGAAGADIGDRFKVGWNSFLSKLGVGTNAATPTATAAQIQALEGDLL